MGILLLILKIIGFLLAFLLVLCATLILVPVRYRVDIKVQEEIEGKAVLHWLFHLVDVRVYYKEKKVSFKLRIFGICLFPKQKKQEGQHGRARIKKAKKDKNISDKPEDAAQSSEEENEGIGEALEEAGPQAPSIQKEAAEEKGTQEKRDRKRKKKRQRKARNSNRIKSKLNKLSRKCKGVARKFHTQEEEGQEEGLGPIGKLKKIISDEAGKFAFLHVWKEVQYLLRHYLPGHVSGTVRFSMGSPDQTGKVLAGISVLPFWARDKLIVMPDFQSEALYLKGILYVTGHARILHVLVTAIRLLKDKNIRKLITNIRE